ncbi:Cytochrome P450 87A3 [Morus notabilis]|uniref:Cytochrome P450 87A3 n=1 Tax=Morus notabilis TaxID=981085 RepID=W9RBX8_9ROSA|nr:Cytochrome P450 87A3 [Morus notabilis]
MLSEMDKATRMHLPSWASQGIVDMKEVASNLLFEYFAKKLISYDETKTSKKLKENYNDAFLDGLISFPLHIPGTAYHACLQGQKNAIKVIRDIFEKRKASDANQGDYLDHLLEELKKEKTILNEKMAIDLLFLLLFAAYESTSTKEHEEIINKRDKKDVEITWQEYKSMTFTHMVINETVRLANIVPAVFRRAAKDVEGKKLHVGSKTFMAFGGGIRVCVGADFAKLQVAIILHYLVSNYK